jgi:NitT/TauT family transport system substrate-binding protein
MNATRISRRNLFKAGAGLATALALPTIVTSRGMAAGGTQPVNMQLGWITGGNQIGEVAAKLLGYFEEEKIDFAIQAGGPSIDGVAIVASGRYEIGQVSSSPSLMLAASQGIPVTCFATGAQKHPYAFFSLAKNPIKTPKDMIGKKIGIQATGQILLTALLKKHNIPEDKVEKVIVGSDMMPLVSGQVDAITGWATNTTQLKILGPDYVSMPLWDEGIQLYGLPYYATQDTLKNKAELVAAFLRAAGKGWAYCKANPEKAVDLLVKEYPNLVKKDELAAEPIMLSYEFTGRTKEHGWGSFDMAVWEDQIKTYADLGQFSAGTPKLESVATTAILDMTKDTRPKIG